MSNAVNIPQPLELLAPARDAEVARQAILHGADAVYIGGPSHGARAAAANQMADIRQLTAFAHQYGAKVYLAVNTIYYDNEAKSVERTIREAWSAGVDALIIQDMGILRLDIPPIELHASTQCDIRTPEKARFLAECGFSQLVLARELSLAEIKAIRQAVPENVRLEAFVHGALCVSYSGDCQASCVANGRSANRGECAQMCRMAYDVVDASGRVLLKDKHVLSLRDLCRIDNLAELAEAGISSFKIEGRLKDANYVKNVVTAYRQAIDRLIAEHPERYCRASWGKVTTTLTADLSKTFNRGYTPYFLNGRPASSVKMANLDSPKWVGERVGTVMRQDGKTVIARLTATLSNGDGLGYYDSKGQFQGFRLNRIDGNQLFPASAVNIPAGAALYRNSDSKMLALMEKPTAKRLIDIDFKLWATGHGLALMAECEDGNRATATVECELQQAKTPQLEARQRCLAKLGDTIYTLRTLSDEVAADAFVPASVLTQLRRDAIAALDQARAATYRYGYRLPENRETRLPQGPQLTYHDNVANKEAEQLYRDHGAQTIEAALETKSAAKSGSKSPLTVMTTRYCLRRELGACLREGGAKKLPEPLYIQNRAARYRLCFDCDRCQMRVVKET